MDKNHYNIMISLMLNGIPLAFAYRIASIRISSNRDLSEEEKFLAYKFGSADTMDDNFTDPDFNELLSCLYFLREAIIIASQSAEKYEIDKALVEAHFRCAEALVLLRILISRYRI